MTTTRRALFGFLALAPAVAAASQVTAAADKEYLINPWAQARYGCGIVRASQIKKIWALDLPSENFGKIAQPIATDGWLCVELHSGQEVTTELFSKHPASRELIEIFRKDGFFVQINPTF